MLTHSYMLAHTHSRLQTHSLTHTHEPCRLQPHLGPGVKVSASRPPPLSGPVCPGSKPTGTLRNPPASELPLPAPPPHQFVLTNVSTGRLFLSFQRDFLSMELVEGQVRLTFDLGSGALVLTSSRRYNTGSWYKLTLQRNRRKGARPPGGGASRLLPVAVACFCLRLPVRHGC